MSNESKSSDLTNTAGVSTGGFLEAALKDLPADARNRLAEEALRKKFEIEAEQRKAQDRFVSSSADMNEMDKRLRDLQISAGNADYTVEGKFQTASGTTSIKVNKNSNMLLIVGLVVAGVVVLIALGS